MKKNTYEKSLVKVNNNSIFYKIKQFFQNLFNRNEITDNFIFLEEDKNEKQKENKRNLFMEEIRKIENEETLILKLQKKYRNGEINEKDLTEEQINSLCKLYDKQISNLKKSNEIRKQKLLEYRRKLQTDN